VTAIRKTTGERTVDWLIAAGMWVVVAITLYPFLYVLSMSISNPIYVIDGSVWLYPKGFSLRAYDTIFDNPDMWRSYGNTIFYTVAGTSINIAMTVLAAYPLARRHFFLRKPIMVFIVVTMFFGGGLIPAFLLMQELGLYNTRWAMLLPGAASAFLIIVSRTFFQDIPESLHESAKLDGAGEFAILLRIVLPLSMPIVAVLALFYAVGHWNSFFPAMMYLPDPRLQPLSIYLIKVIIQNSDVALKDMIDQHDRSMISVQLKYAMIIVTIAPILMIYPFLQKYFVKGVMIGSLKE